MYDRGVAFHWRKFKERYCLIGSSCENCKNHFYPARNICPVCRRKGKLHDVKFCGKGTVYSHTVIRSPPTGFEAYIPYIIAMVELQEGARVISQIVDCRPEDVRIGMEVEAVFRKITEENISGLVLYGFKFVPVRGK